MLREASWKFLKLCEEEKKKKWYRLQRISGLEVRKAEISGWGDAVNVALLRIHAKREEAWCGCCVWALASRP